MNGRFFVGATAAALVASAIAVKAGETGPSARAIVQQAVLAVEGDSVAAVSKGWRARPTERGARLGLATLARLTYDYTSAEEQYRALVPPKAVPDLVGVYALLGLAWQADTRGMLQQADTLFRHARAAARLSRDSAAEAEALIGWASQRAPVAGMTVGLAILDSARVLIPASAVGLESRYLIGRAVFRAVSGHPGAREDALRSRRLARDVGDRRLEAKALRALALIPALSFKLKDNQSSINALLDTAAMLQRQAHDRSGLSETLLRRADALYYAGDLGQFKALSIEAEHEATVSHNNLASRSILLGLGALSVLVHDFAAADDYLSRAIAQCEADGDAEMTMMARSQRLYLYLAVGATDYARREAEAILAYHQATSEFTSQFEVYQTLTAIYLRSGQLAAANAALGQATALAARKHESHWMQRLYADRGAVAMAEHDAPAAIGHFTRAIAVLDSVEHVARYDLRARLAEAYATVGDLPRAEAELTGADEELSRWRSTLADPALRKMAFQVSPRPENNRNASVAATIALLAGHGHADGAFRLAERRRARELTDRLVRATALAADSISRAKGVTSHSTTWIHPANGGADLDTLLADEHTVLLEYVTGALGAPTTLFIVTRDAAGKRLVRSRILASADSLAPKISRFVALIEAGSDPTALSRDLGAQLLDPALDALGPARTSIVRAVIVPDGPLHSVPFDALRLEDGHYAMERWALSFAPSGGVIPALRQRAAQRSVHPNTPVRLLALGNPWRQASDTLPALPGAEREVSIVARYAAAAEIWTGAQATPAALRAAPLSDYRVLHFATHAMVDDRSDANTALVLAASDNNTGLMSPGDIAALPIGADLVVLSACHTAGGVVVDGEGVQGLALAFLQAGARTIVATQWRIDDAATTRFIQHFYSELAQKLPVSDALRQAKLDAVRRGAPPREWAAFTVVGDPLVQISFREPAPARTRTFWMIAALFGVTGFAFFAFRFVTRNG